MTSRRSALSVYLIMTGLRSFLFWTAFITGSIYYIVRVGLNPLQLVLVGTVLELTAFACEIPTGVIADVKSRKLSVILGFVVIGIGFMLQGLVPRFAAILVAQLFYGSGWTFISGAEDAWLADEIGNDRLAHAYVKAKQIQLAASFAGIFASVALASVALNLPFLLSGLGLLAVAAWLVRLMPETNYHPSAPAERNTWAKLRKTLTDGLHSIRVSPLLWTILGVTLVYGVSREGIDRLWEAHILDNVALPALGELPMVVWFGAINAGAMLAALLLTFLLRRALRRIKDRQAIAWLTVRYVLLGAAIAAFGVARSFVWIVAAYVAVYVLREVGDAVQSAWVNRSVDSTSRATVLSTVSQMDALGQAGGGPVLGAIGVRWGLRASMLAASAILVPLLALLTRARRLVSKPPDSRRS